jgi:hypothetical protein
MIALHPVAGLADRSLLPGLHWLGIREFRDTFVLNFQRAWQFEGFVKACMALQQAGCRRVYVGGSYITSKEFPGDYDACWDPAGVSALSLDPVLYDSDRREECVKIYRGEWFIAKEGNGPESAMYTYLSRDRDTGIERGMVGIKLNSIELYNL